MLEQADLDVKSLGRCTRPTPLGGYHERFVDDAERVLLSADVRDLDRPLSFERAGPREKIYFDPASIACGIVTCGGLCPGLNDVIRSLVMTASYGYGVKRILGFRFGFAGLRAEPSAPPLELTPGAVERIHEDGGTILGSSRGPQDTGEMVSTLERHGVGLLFCIGGDGTLRGASDLVREIARRELGISVVCVPKTIDNDLMWVQRSFGFHTAVEEARRAIAAAHVEAKGAWNGIGLVKLMGRHSGFIAAEACLANNDANFCLLPEVRFTLDGRGGLLERLEQRLEQSHHAVIVVGEGAGQELMQREAEARDASGNILLADIGRFLHQRIAEHLTHRGIPTAVKYIDPSYMIRSVPANPNDGRRALSP